LTSSSHYKDLFSFQYVLNPTLVFCFLRGVSEPASDVLETILVSRKGVSGCRAWCVEIKWRGGEPEREGCWGMCGLLGRFYFNEKSILQSWDCKFLVTLQAQMAMLDSQRYPWNLYLIIIIPICFPAVKMCQPLLKRKPKKNYQFSNLSKFIFNSNLTVVN